MARIFSESHLFWLFCVRMRIPTRNVQKSFACSTVNNLDNQILLNINKKKQTLYKTREISNSI